MITLSLDDRYEILQRARTKSVPVIIYENVAASVIDATLEQIRLNEARSKAITEPEQIPIGMDYISEDDYLYTWDGKYWSNDGPVSNETRILLRMIRELTNRLIAVERSTK